jgi:hypothetical protein
MPKPKNILLSLKRRILKRPDASHSCFAHVALSVAVSGLAALCGINKFLDHNILLQSVTSATFCISAGVLYAIYMIISRLLALVLNYAERHTSHYYSDLSPEKYDDNNNDESCGGGKCDDANNDSSGSDLELYVIKHKKKYLKGLPRNVVISSMYLGGSGAFLAIPPLCMWDFTITSAFIMSMTILSFLDCGKVISDFQPNVDTGRAITNLKALRCALHILVVAAISCVIWLDSSDEMHVVSIAHVNGTVFWGEGSGLILRWPLILLAASSPILLRAGGGGVGPFTHSLPPSQTLETGLPVSILLAILVICWYSPLEGALLMLAPLRDKIYLGTLIPMLIFSPPFLSAALAFVLRGFKNRSSYTTAMILTIVLVVRQQIQRKVASSIDGVSLGLSAFILLTMITFVIYKKRVEMKPLLKHKAAADTETGNLVVVVNNDELPNDKDREYDDDDEGDSETTMAKNKPGLH